MKNILILGTIFLITACSQSETDKLKSDQKKLEKQIVELNKQAEPLADECNKLVAEYKDSLAKNSPDTEAKKEAGKKVIFVNCSGSAIALTPETESCDAILQAWYPGESGGQAAAGGAEAESAAATSGVPAASRASGGSSASSIFALSSAWRLRSLGTSPASGPV